MLRRLFAAGIPILLAASAPVAGESLGAPAIPDTRLVNQDGAEVRFLTDVIGDRLAAVTFTFTTCHTICPRLDGIFRSLQDKIAADMGRDTVLVTLSVNPADDVPERLKAHAEMLGARSGWSFLTGNKERVNDLLRALEVYTPDIYEHPPTVFVVDGRRREWTRLSGFPSPDKLAEILARHRQARSAE